MEYDSFAHTRTSLAAAMMLGPGKSSAAHPNTTTSRPSPTCCRPPNRRALLIHDTVPGRTGYLAEFADHTKVWAVLAAARRIVDDCPCQHEDRLACHRCLLPFTAPHEMDKVSRAAAAKLLSNILDAPAGTEPDLNDWAVGVTAEAPPPTPLSDESFLQRVLRRLHRVAPTDRRNGGREARCLRPVGGHHDARRQVPEMVAPRQVSVDFAKPDFELHIPDPDIPKIAIFADGQKFHAVPGCNRVADDADKRENLRKEGYWVWSFSHQDLERFKAGEDFDPGWFDQTAAGRSGGGRP